MNPTILLVEDDKNDVFLMERAPFGKASVPGAIAQRVSVRNVGE